MAATCVMSLLYQPLEWFLNPSLCHKYVKLQLESSMAAEKIKKIIVGYSTDPVYRCIKNDSFSMQVLYFLNLLTHKIVHMVSNDILNGIKVSNDVSLSVSRKEKHISANVQCI